jgi:Patatin-like phospholipase
MGLFALFKRKPNSRKRKRPRGGVQLPSFGAQVVASGARVIASGARVVASVKEIRIFPTGKLYLNPDTIRPEEEEKINDRRTANGRKHVRPFRGFGRRSRKRPKEPVYDTVGLALSGGGVRSAAFSLGVTQALNLADVFGRIDYLSTVSGGGYIGSTITAGMTLDPRGRFPVPSELRRDEPPVVQHIRDYSNYLIPHGFGDVIRSAAVYLRGLAANVLLILPWLLLAATITILFYPTRDSLKTAGPLVTWWTKLSTLPFLKNLTAIGYVIGLKQYFIATCILLGLLFVALLAWSIRRSMQSAVNQPEIPGFLSSLFFWFLIAVGVVAFCELQPFILDALFRVQDSDHSHPDKTTFGLFIKWLQSIIIWLTPIAAVVGLWGNKLTWMVKGVTENSKFTQKLKRVAIKALIYVAGAVVPILVWFIYLQFAFDGIYHCRDEAASRCVTQVEAPHWLIRLADWFVDKIPQIGIDGSHWLQAQTIKWMDGTLPSIDSAHDFYALWSFYLLVFVVLALVSWLLEPNANSLHRLYRDRLSKAFLVCPTERSIDPDATIETIKRLPLNKLANVKAPYHLINAALNIQSSRAANRRGRNADFFLFSGEFVGSRSTGYVKTAEMERQSPEVDVATAMAISGAAAASNMGTSSIRWVSPSLAILNVRLGYWLRNPGFMFGVSSLWRKLHDVFNLYFLYEMFGLLSEKRPFVYLTDGGHVENLGAYELLRRRCCLLIIVDAEADNGMHFESLVRLERYARIDLGIRLELPWQEIRSATLEISKQMQERGDPGALLSRTGPHCAIGKIYYPEGEGRILYVKSSLTGDESNYVIDYKRRNPSFPHETTGDQFFTEEQFEAYRALGFHVMQGFFSGRDDIAVPARKARDNRAWRRAVITTRRRLKRDVMRILRPKKTEVLPTVVAAPGWADRPA